MSLQGLKGLPGVKGERVSNSHCHLFLCSSWRGGHHCGEYFWDRLGGHFNQCMEVWSDKQSPVRSGLWSGCTLSFCKTLLKIFFRMVGREEIWEFGQKGIPVVFHLIPQCAGLGWGAAHLQHMQDKDYFPDNTYPFILHPLAEIPLFSFCHFPLASLGKLRSTAMGRVNLVQM